MVIMTSDIESQGFTKTYLCGSICYKTSTGNYKHQEFKNKEDHYNWIIEKGKQLRTEKHRLNIYFHNSAFDLTRLINFKDPNIKIIKKNKPIIIGYGDNPYQENEYIYIYFLDTMPIFQKSLEKIGQQIGTQKTKTNPVLDYKHKQDTPQNYTFEELNELQQYCNNDTLILLKAIEQIQQNLKNEGLRVNQLISAGQIAMRTFNKQLQNTQEKWNIFQIPTEWHRGGLIYIKPKHPEETRKATRGGRFQMFKYGKINNTTAIDYNSLYPDATTKMPLANLNTEQMIKEPLKQLNEQDILEQTGITKCMITIPKNEYGILPIRIKNLPTGNTELDEENNVEDYESSTRSKSQTDLPRQIKMGVAYPEHKTTLIGSWTNLELTNAIKQGAKIHAIEHTINWANCKTNPLAEYMKNLYKKRQENPNESWFYKTLMNNLTGKFSQENDDEEYIIENIDETPKIEAQGYQRTLRQDTNILFTKRNGKTPSNYYAPIYSTYIYATARQIIQKEIQKIPREDLINLTNDGIIFKGNHLDKFNIGNELGQFKIVQDDEGEIINKPYIGYGIDNYMIGNNIKLNGISHIYQNKEQFKQGKINYKIMTSLGKATTYEQAGEFTERTRDLHMTKKNAKQREKLLKKQKLIIDKYTDPTYFQLEGYI